MKISRFAARGVLGLRDLDLDFSAGAVGASGGPRDVVIISGPPASGKTRLFDLMLAALEAVGPYHGMVRASDWCADLGKGARVELGLLLEGLEGSVEGSPGGAAARAVVDFTADGVLTAVDRRVAKVVSRYDHDPAHGKREYFPEGRQRAWGARCDGLGELEQSLLRSTKDAQKYSFVPRFLAELRHDVQRRATFARQLELLSPSVRFAAAPRKDPTACFKNRMREEVPFVELSSSESEAVIIAATATLIGLHRSVIFLDRPELHVPSDRLAAFVEALLQLGEQNQWFIATSDRDLAASLPRAHHVSLGSGAAQPARGRLQ
ncbi:Hypothetical protein A7982_06659 [Minicystis rosea]|nr:Hypothetical protein A7982_06659 [Minicystis rosea]